MRLDYESYAYSNELQMQRDKMWLLSEKVIVGPRDMNDLKALHLFPKPYLQWFTVSKFEVENESKTSSRKIEFSSFA